MILKKGKEAAEHLKMALEIWREYGIFESHDTLQQLMNLTNMLILAKKSGFIHLRITGSGA